MSGEPPLKRSPPADSDTRRPISQKVSVHWDDSEQSATTMRFSLAECVETKTITTTTTTTKRTFPPIRVREPRPLHTLDHKEYPLARKPTPKEIANFSWDLSQYTPQSFRAVAEAELPEAADGTSQRDLTLPLEDSTNIKTEPMSDITPTDSPTRPIRQPFSFRDRMQKKTSTRPINLSLPHAVADRLCQSHRSSLPCSNADRGGLPATPDTIGLSISRVVDDLASFSPEVPTPPVERYPNEFASADQDSSQESVLPRPARTHAVAAAQSDTLPSPGLSPTLAAIEPTGNDMVLWDDENQQLDEETPESMVPVHAAGVESMLRDFDRMPKELQSFMIYQMLRRCSRRTLHMVANVVNPALQCDFIKELPNELSLMILGYLDHKDLCNAAQVSKYWRNIIDTNESGWKELLDQDGLDLPPGELETAITQGWGWQDPVGYYSGEKDISKRSTAKSTVPQGLAKKSGHQQRMSTRKRSMPAAYSDRSKRRASGPEKSHPATSVSPWALSTSSVIDFEREGPIAHATAAALAVPDPGLGLSSLRKLHLYKSIYRRRHMIRSSWTKPDFKPHHVAFAAHPRHVITCLQFDDDKIVTGSDDTLIQVYDTRTGELRRTLHGHEGGVWALHYVGNTLVSGSTDRSVRVWDIQRGLCSDVLWGHTSTVRCLQILMPTEVEQPDQKMAMPSQPLIITGSRDSQLRVWRLPQPGQPSTQPSTMPANDRESPFLIKTLTGHTHSVRAIAAHADVLVSGSYDSTVRVWKISTGECLQVLSGHTQKVYSVALDLKRNRCISGSMDSNVRIWDLATGQCIHVLEGHSLLVGLLDLKQERLVSAAADGTLRVWDPDSGRCRQILTAHTGAITCFQHDSVKVISGSEKSVKIWDIATGECVQNLLSDLTGVWQVAFDGRRCIAAIQRDGITYLEILDFGAARDGKPQSELGKRIVLNPAEVQRLMREVPRSP